MDGARETAVQTGPLKSFKLDTRFRLLELVADPQFAYMLFMGSLALIYFEFTHPGTIAPGVIGGIGLIVSLIAMDKLNVEWAGLVLILLGIAMLVAEMFLPTMGLLGIGGIVAFVMGSIFLFDPAKTGGYTLPLSLILPVAIFAGVMMLGLGFLASKAWRVKKRGGFEELIGQTARVSRSAGVNGYVEIMGEQWKYLSDTELFENDAVKITGHDGLVLRVHKES
jgi:membrane-bound serine protease (ClpP class)